MDDMNLVELVEQFADEKKCRSYLEALRWPDGPVCPRCKAVKIYRIVEREQFVCDSCDYQFSVTAGTIFHDSHLPLWKWFLAAYLMMESKKAMSANQMKRTLAVSYKTAWYLCHRIRKAIEEAEVKPKLTGIVEVDETFVGGKYDRRRKRLRWKKQAVIGLLQRGGQFESRTIPSRTKKVLVGIVKNRTSKDAKVFTDEFDSYHSLGKFRKHKSVNHSENEWARGRVHTNNIENAWSLFKRSVVGSYHKVSEKHLDAYLDEFEWRFNNRKNQFLFRDTVLRLISSSNLKYKALTGQQSESAA
jgi:transposase-like protein